MKQSLNSLTITQAQTGLRSKQFSPVELVQSCLDRIQAFDTKIHAFLTLNADAIKQSQKADVSQSLGGIPIVVKDNFLTHGLRTTASSKVLDNYIPQYDATVVKKLKKAGAIIIGKTNMDAWAHGSSTETSDYGPTLNPWNTDFLPGGSSGGSAAAVAADFCIAGIGSETAGSIRQPAAWCGVTGFKPTYGRVSRYGVIAMASSTDSPGPITKNVTDSAFLSQVIAGNDPFDATTSPIPVPNYYQNSKLKFKKFKIGLPREYMQVMQPAALPLITTAVNQLESLGHVVEEISLIHPKYSIGVYTLVQRSEVSSNLARYDGIRYGYGRSAFSAEAKRRIMLGTYALSSGYYDKYYQKAQKVRSLIIQDFSAAFSQVDLIIDPPSPGPALPVGATVDQAMFGEMQDILVEPSSIAGLTGISVPCGFIGGLPLGFGLIGPQFAESRVFQVAHQYQQVTQWHEQKPTL
ncbi:glutaminyl-tRNA synthase (glutamine-hydrolyzing) subunit A [Candidatus Amesbacteria bacterium RIFCSPLOWO2_02_FULL_48_11]|uniref:Glutamyl-tRNA(Gln) amidotransferase subunit A n=3 Tax=Candidatus Amesiibacteriota TaxID=1752730 RepID=A0A1F4Z7G1_9BACT|nr:MAG: glutamyl-tRNA(Gln) amidotransferase, A subunit, aspartyl-tRNA(Asn)/glutamyl-tRNA (Gln) amidotransferase subunit A [Candidatus Amesbacteria bacterium GW2011_GWC1_48_10]KKU99588.1 MAG: Glutamyl-tRNA(Gln) amidotransferase subunit A [Candidatus Amesbacteria bacterium GW2011_GWA1_48_9]OGC89749.1 MAG: glutaminyl-tRNA synthase (glutamine-hydrolyzing) subunit A [Candidatus Amesbacteria bacterium RBG_19FT_COMBO_48_16]OGC96708.1 MAG: glutaminyl-tRNA synthase (glutamine-hydrolyzing) subunit A [Cand